MAKETIFAKIVRKEVPADIVYEDNEILAFRDIRPQAPTHVLVIPKRPLENLEEAGPRDAALLGRLLLVARDLSGELGLTRGGYRLVLNNGADAGQEVPHIHVHLLAGRRLAWPPG
ncbi:MAG: histidine triad nucleotide-binding protein [Planctomycetota bacterium]